MLLCGTTNLRENLAVSDETSAPEDLLMGAPSGK